MKEKIIKSKAERGEYLISEDVRDTKDNREEVCFSVFFRKIGIDDWESVDSFDTEAEAEDYVIAEVEKAEKILYGTDWGYRGVADLDRDELLQLKQRYLTQLADEGRLNEVVYNRPEWDECEETAGVSCEELANAHSLVSDEFIIDYYNGTVFTDEDFIK